MDSLRRTRRELRDEFQARAAMLHATSERALDSAGRAPELEPEERAARPPSWPRAAGRDRASSARAARTARRAAAVSPQDDPLTAAVARSLVERGPGNARSTRSPRDQLTEAVERLSRAAPAGHRRPGEGRQVDAAERAGRRGAGADRRRRVHAGSSPGTSAATTVRVVAVPHGRAAPSSARTAASGGALDVDLGAPVEDVDHLEVSWPSSRLRDVTLVDTPGIASLSTEVSQRTSTLLSAEDDRPPVVDAVLYLLRHTPRQRHAVPRGVPRRRARPRHARSTRSACCPAPTRSGRAGSTRWTVGRPRGGPLRARPADPPPLPAGHPGRGPARPGRGRRCARRSTGRSHDRRRCPRTWHELLLTADRFARRRRGRPADPARAGAPRGPAGPVRRAAVGDADPQPHGAVGD